MTDMTLEAVVRTLTAFNSWSQMAECLTTGREYCPTIFPQTPDHVRLRDAVRAAGGRVFPAPQVKLTQVTDAQMDRIEDFIELSADSGDKRAQRDARRAKTTRTTATLSLDLATDLLSYLDYSKQDAIENAGCGNARTDAEAAFAERAVERSFDALIKKVEKAMRRAQ